MVWSLIGKWLDDAASSSSVVSDFPQTPMGAVSWGLHVRRRVK